MTAYTQIDPIADPYSRLPKDTLSDLGLNEYDPSLPCEDDVEGWE